MLTALWTVLGIFKIIGLILLGIIGFLLVILFLVLLVPVRYQARISYDGRPEGQAGVSWLCRLLSVKAIYKEKLAVRVRILGIPVFRMEKAFGKEKTEEQDPAGEYGAKEAGSRETGSEGEAKDAGGKEPDGEVTETKEADREEPGGEVPDGGVPDGEVPGEEEGKEPAPTKKVTDRKQKKQPKRKPKKKLKKKAKKKAKKERKNRGFSFRKICDKLKEKLGRIKEALAGVKEKKEKLEAFVKDPANRRTYRLLKRQLWKLCRHVLPVKVSGRVRFGFGDPYKTGQVLTYISPFYGLYAKKLQIIPVFEESLLEGEGKIKGRIRIGTVLFIAVRMLLDKNFRVLLKKILEA